MMQESRKKILEISLVVTFVLCLVIILWGAFVRFSGSGDGCGASWPLCGGKIVPAQDVHYKVWIEYAHRATSGLLGILVFLQVVFGFLWTGRGHPLRRCLALVGVFTVSEALIGAGLVLFSLVGEDSSSSRVLWLLGHLGNTLLLLASITLAYLQVRFEKGRLPILPSRALLPYLVVFFFVACLGAVASLSNTLYPSQSLASGILADFHHSSPLLVRLRIFHPLFGVLFFLLIIEWWQKSTMSYPIIAKRLLWITGLNFLIGATTLVLLSPLPGRLLHILVTDLLWVQLYGMAVLIRARNSMGRAGTPEFQREVVLTS
ncbi:MAG: COX15/CtaA family protein [Bdellovibrionales bacterium]|nr:COX15/CtaA family protein [Bdellovibrionales bacterium]